jgi:hypothetical protein
VSWKITYYDDVLVEAILSLPKDLQARYIRITERMVLDGPDIGMPHTRPMSKGLFEVRLRGRDNIARIFYCTLKGR